MSAMLASRLLIICCLSKASTCMHPRLFVAETEQNGKFLQRQAIESLHDTTDESPTVTAYVSGNVGDQHKQVMYSGAGGMYTAQGRKGTLTIDPMAHTHYAKKNEENSKIMEMENEYNSMRVLLKKLEDQKDILQKVGLVEITEKSIADVIADIKIYHDGIQELIQDRISMIEHLSGNSKISTHICNLKYLDESSPKSTYFKNRMGDIRSFKLPSSQNHMTEMLAMDKASLKSTSNEAQAAWVQQLVQIFDSLKIPVEKNHEHSSVEMKVLYEKCFFQTIQFMYKFDFINEETLERFFSSKGTLQRIGFHLYDLFQPRSGGFSYHYSFVPEMGYICDHFKTGHLQDSFKALGEEVQGVILYEALKSTIQIFKDNHKERISKEGEKIFDLFIDEKRNWPGKVFKQETCQETSTDSSLRNPIETIISHFSRPPQLKDYRGNKLESKIEYLLVYHILNYLNTYHVKYKMADHFKNGGPQEYEIFSTHMELFSKGLKIYGLIGKALDKKEVSKNSNEIEKISNIKIKQAIKAKGLVKEYENLMANVEKLKSENENITGWQKDDTPSREILNIFQEAVNSIKMRLFYPERNMWLVSLDS